MAGSQAHPLAADCVRIDGSMMEGGGQILRNAAALAAITGTSIQVSRIRFGRKQPGLRAQHLSGLQLVTNICSGQLDGGHVGSTEIVLKPQRPRVGAYSIDVGTAGSCTLLAQAALPCLLMAADREGRQAGTGVSVLDFKGGTDAAMAPPIGYMQHVLLPMLAKVFGGPASQPTATQEISCKLERRGFYPKGGGRIVVSIPALQPGASLKGFSLQDRGEIQAIDMQAFTAGRVHRSKGQRMADAAVATLKKGLGGSVSVNVKVVEETQASAFGDGIGILIMASTSTGCLLGASSPGERGTPAEAIGESTANELLEDINANGCVDRWLQDQLIIFMAMASGTSRITCGEPTLHTRTAIAVAEQLTCANFTVKEPTQPGGPWSVDCNGQGSQAGALA